MVGLWGNEQFCRMWNLLMVALGIIVGTGNLAFNLSLAHAVHVARLVVTAVSESFEICFQMYSTMDTKLWLLYVLYTNYYVCTYSKI